MDPIVEFAKMFKARDNPSVQGVGVGKVISAPPELKVTFNGLLLDSWNMVASAHLMTVQTTSPASIADHGTHTHTVDYTLKVGDGVIVIPSADNAKYFVVGKVG